MSDDRPRFTVVIPTRNRPDTLKPCLQTCLAQGFDDYEIVVADNCGTSETADVIKGFDSSRIVHLRSESPLAMSVNWERGVEAARGQYVTLIGDDDGLMPYALRELDLLIREHHEPEAIHWRRGIYTWPTMGTADANLLAFSLSRGLRELRGRTLIGDVLAFRTGPEMLPTVHSAVVRRDLLDKLRGRAGRVFPSMYPDDFAGFALGWLCTSYISLDVPMHLAGVSKHSNGAATLLKPGGKAGTAEFWDLNRHAGLKAHPLVPDLPLVDVHWVDSFEWARELVFDEPIESYDRAAMVQRYLQSIPSMPADQRTDFLAAIRESLKDRADLQSWLDASAQELEPAAWPKLTPANLGYDGNWIWLDAARFDVQDIGQAVATATSILGVTEHPIAWVPSASPAAEHSVSEQMAKLREERDSLRMKNRRLKARCADLQRQLSEGRRPQRRLASLARRLATRPLRLKSRER